jgi:hypothetical protein
VFEISFLPNNFQFGILLCLVPFSKPVLKSEKKSA